MRWACLKCTKDFDSKAGYDDHMRSASHNLRCYHPDCSHLVFDNIGDWRAHKFTFPHPQVYECNPCQMGFKTGDALKQHRRTSAAHHPHPAYFVVPKQDIVKQARPQTALPIRSRPLTDDLSCALCDASFETQPAYKAHLNSLGHIRKKDPKASIKAPASLYCDDCERWFVDNDAYEQHMRNATIHRTCQICGYVCDTPTGLEQHIRSSVHNPASLTCGGDCDKRFKDLEALNQHLRGSPMHACCSKCGGFISVSQAVPVTRGGVRKKKVLCPTCAASKKHHGQDAVKTAQVQASTKVAAEPPSALAQKPLIRVDDKTEALSPRLGPKTEDLRELLCIFCTKDAFPNRDALRWHMASEHMYCTYCVELSDSIESLFQHFESQKHITNRAKWQQNCNAGMNCPGSSVVPTPMSSAGSEMVTRANRVYGTAPAQHTSGQTLMAPGAQNTANGRGTSVNKQNGLPNITDPTPDWVRNATIVGTPFKFPARPTFRSKVLSPDSQEILYQSSAYSTQMVPSSLTESAYGNCARSISAELEDYSASCGKDNGAALVPAEFKAYNMIGEGGNSAKLISTGFKDYNASYKDNNRATLVSTEFKTYNVLGEDDNSAKLISPEFEDFNGFGEDEDKADRGGVTLY